MSKSEMDLQLELDELRQKLRQTEKLYEQEKGKRIAVERDNFAVKREAQQIKTEAEALQSEAMASISTGAEQLMIAMGISQGVYALGQLAHRGLVERAIVARTLYREKTYATLIGDLIQAVKSGSQDKISTAVNAAQVRLDTVNKNSEDIRARIERDSIAAFRRNAANVLYPLMEEGLRSE